MLGGDAGGVGVDRVVYRGAAGWIDVFADG